MDDGHVVAGPSGLLPLNASSSSFFFPFVIRCTFDTMIPYLLHDLWRLGWANSMLADSVDVSCTILVFICSLRAISHVYSFTVLYNNYPETLGKVLPDPVSGFNQSQDISQTPWYLGNTK